MVYDLWLIFTHIVYIYSLYHLMANESFHFIPVISRGCGIGNGHGSGRGAGFGGIGNLPPSDFSS